MVFLKCHYCTAYVLYEYSYDVNPLEMYVTCVVYEFTRRESTRVLFSGSWWMSAANSCVLWVVAGVGIPDEPPILLRQCCDLFFWTTPWTGCEVTSWWCLPMLRSICCGWWHSLIYFPEIWFCHQRQSLTHSLFGGWAVSVAVQVSTCQSFVFTIVLHLRKAWDMLSNHFQVLTRASSPFLAYFLSLWTAMETVAHFLQNNIDNVTPCPKGI